MKGFPTLVIKIGDYLTGISDRTRSQLVLVALLLLGGLGTYKLTISIQRLNDPLPAATPDQILKPMGKLFQPAKESYGTYQQTRRQLDSLKFNPTTLPK